MFTNPNAMANADVIMNILNTTRRNYQRLEKEELR